MFYIQPGQRTAAARSSCRRSLALSPTGLHSGQP
jgi:hypothetical protein